MWGAELCRKAMGWSVLSLALTSCDDVENNRKLEKAFEQQKATLKSQEQRIINLERLEQRVASLEAKAHENATSFNECVLQSMQGITSDLAAEAVKESCLRKVSVPLPEIYTLAKSKAAYGQIYGYTTVSFGLYITLINLSQYTITEVTISVLDKKRNTSNTYVARLFPAPVPQGTFFTGLPKDRTLMMQLPPGQRVFTIEITEQPKEQNTFFDQYGWGIIAAKGFIN